MSKQSVKTTINDNIKQNGHQEITGQIMNSVLNEMVDNLAEEASTTEKLTELEEKVGCDKEIANGDYSVGKVFLTYDDAVLGSIVTVNVLANKDAIIRVYNKQGEAGEELHQGSQYTIDENFGRLELRYSSSQVILSVHIQGLIGEIDKLKKEYEYTSEKVNFVDEQVNGIKHIGDVSLTGNGTAPIVQFLDGLVTKGNTYIIKVANKWSVSDLSSSTRVFALQDEAGNDIIPAITQDNYNNMPSEIVLNADKERYKIAIRGNVGEVATFGIYEKQDSILTRLDNLEGRVGEVSGTLAGNTITNIFIEDYLVKGERYRIVPKNIWNVSSVSNGSIVFIMQWTNADNTKWGDVIPGVLKENFPNSLPDEIIFNASEDRYKIIVRGNVGEQANFMIEHLDSGNVEHTSFNYVEDTLRGGRFKYDEVGVMDYYNAWDELAYSCPKLNILEPIGYSQTPEGDRAIKDSNVYPINHYCIANSNATKRLVLMGAIHGDSEWQPSQASGNGWYGDGGDSPQNILCLFWFVENLLLNPNAKNRYKKLLNDYEIDIIPIINPWGVQNHSRRNGRGVNCNRNFDHEWEEIPSGEGTGNYKGTSPFSESESKAVRDFITSKNDISRVVEIHARGNIVMSDSLRWYAGIADNYPYKSAYNLAVNMAKSRFGGDGGYAGGIFPGTCGGWINEVKHIPAFEPELAQSIGNDIATRNSRLTNFQMTEFLEELIFVGE